LWDKSGAAAGKKGVGKGSKGARESERETKIRGRKMWAHLTKVPKANNKKEHRAPKRY